MQVSNVIKYLRYLSEKVPRAVIKKKLKKHRKLLIQAPTGCGKTYFFINHAKGRKGKTIFLVPNVANVEQIAKEYCISGVHGLQVKEGIWMNNNVIVATYDKAGAFLKSNLDNLLVVIDEAHNLQSQANFRSDAIQRVKKLVVKSKEAIFLSATINHLDHRLYGKILRFESKKPKNIIGNSKILTSGKNSNKDVALDLIRKLVSEGKRCLVKMNHKKSLYQLQESLKDSNIISSVLTTENKSESQVMMKILNEQTLPSDYQVVFCTSLLDAGVNLKEVDVIIDIENGDPNAIRQLSARPRVSLKEHYIIIKGNTKDRKPEDRYTRDKVEATIKRRLKESNSIKSDIETWLMNLKKESQRCLRFKFSLVENSIDEEFFVKTNSDGKFYVDVEALRNVEYENYYNSLQTNPELLKHELEAYGLFTTIEEYFMDKPSFPKYQEGAEISEDSKEKDLSEYLKTLQGIKEQNFALECYLSKDSENLFSSNKYSHGINVPFSIFNIFGMYMALGFQYRLAYELMMKSYLLKQKRKKVKNYMQKYVYSNLKDDPRILKDKSYRSFKLLYDLYGTEESKEISIEDEENTLKAYTTLFGKKYTKNKLTNRGGELVILEKKSGKKDGKTYHYKVSKGLHTANSILATFEITEEPYVQEFQDLLADKVKNKSVDLYVKKIFAPNAPEKNSKNIFEGEESIYFHPILKNWMERSEDEKGMGKPITSPYFPKVIKAEENLEIFEKTMSKNEVGGRNYE